MASVLAVSAAAVAAGGRDRRVGLTIHKASYAHLAGYLRGPWRIDNQLRYVHDVPAPDLAAASKVGARR